MMSTGGNSAPLSFVISPTWTISGKWYFVTSMGKASISLAHKVLMLYLEAASGKPPIPSNRLPIVSISFPLRYLTTAAMVFVVFTTVCAV